MTRRKVLAILILVASLAIILAGLPPSWVRPILAAFIAFMCGVYYSEDENRRGS